MEFRKLRYNARSFLTELPAVEHAQQLADEPLLMLSHQFKGTSVCPCPCFSSQLFLEEKDFLQESVYQGIHFF